MSIYIHIPFCASICSYCDFAKLYYKEELVDKYLDALKNEINSKYKGEVINTLYFGGGTPSCLNIKQIEKLFNITKKFKLKENAEITFECNIENIEENKMILLKQNNVNRISIGIQTFNDKYLNFLNRKHTKKEIFEKIQMIKKYISNINVDLMYAFNEQTLEELKEDIEYFKKLNVPHISTYSLIIEPHTVLYNKKTNNIDDELDASMYETIINELKEYEHYETSNFSKPGFESQHNLTYWDNKEYYGFGCGASGFVNNVRYDNTRNIYKYINNEYISSEEEMSRNMNIENEFLLGFRKVKGINIDAFIMKYNCDPLEFENVKELIKKNKLEINDNYLRIKKEYLYLANEILIEFIGENYEKE